MKIKTVTVSDKGQIAIPIEIRKSLHLEKGSTVVLIQEGDKILIEKSEKVADWLKDDFKDLLKLSEISLKDIWDGEEDI